MMKKDKKSVVNMRGVVKKERKGDGVYASRGTGGKKEKTRIETLP